jgi:hypothetical protein
MVTNTNTINYLLSDMGNLKIMKPGRYNCGLDKGTIYTLDFYAYSSDPTRDNRLLHVVVDPTGCRTAAIANGDTLSLSIDPAGFLADLQKAFENGSVTTNETFDPSLPPHPIPYTSNSLGIRFTYYPQLSVQNFFTREIGNRIYIYDNVTEGSGGQPFPGTDAEFLGPHGPGGKYVEVFIKNPTTSLTDAVRKQFLAGTSPNDCSIIPAPNVKPFLEKSYEAVMIRANIPPTPDLTYQQRQEYFKRCKNHSSNFVGVSYFVMDPRFPEKFIFVELGEDDIPAGVNGLMWDGSIEVLQ